MTFVSIPIKNLFVSANTSLRVCIRKLNDTAQQILLVQNHSQNVIGTISDGDIRRALLSGLDLDSLALECCNTEFYFSKRGDRHSAILSICKERGIRHVPVFDASNILVDLLVIGDSGSRKQGNAVVIMAGGKGSRLRPLTNSCPKPMLLVDGKPILEILLEHFIQHGFYQFYFSVNYLKEQIIDYFGDGSSWGVSICYLVEDQPLGTAGSLQFLPHSEKAPFFVLNGDVLTRLDPCQVLNFHHEHDAMATMCVREHFTTIPFGVVHANGVDLAGFQEKPSYRQLVNAGVYVIDPRLLPLLPARQTIDMPDFLQSARQVGHRITVYPINEYWLDVGRPETLKQAHQEWPRKSEL